MQISLEEIVRNAVHFGHRAHRWNPKMKPYLYGSKNGIHIFDAHKTREMLEKALEFLKKQCDQGSVILFVSTKPQTKELLQELQKDTGHPIVMNSWVGGMLTNFATIRERIKYLKSIREMIATGEIRKFNKKERSSLTKEKEKLEHSFGGIVDMYRLPDVLFVVDGKRDQTALREAKRLKIPVVGFMDSNVDPDYFDYGIPANDDAISSLTYLLSFVFDVVKQGRKRGKKEEDITVMEKQPHPDPEETSSGGIEKE